MHGTPTCSPGPLAVAVALLTLAQILPLVVLVRLRLIVLNLTLLLVLVAQTMFLLTVFPALVLIMWCLVTTVLVFVSLFPTVRSMLMAQILLRTNYHIRRRFLLCLVLLLSRSSP